TKTAMEGITDFGEKLSRATLDRKDALRELASITEKLKDQFGQLNNSAVQRLQKSARSGGTEATGPELQKQADDLKKQLGTAADQASLDKVKAELNKLQQTAKDLAKSDSASAQSGQQKLSDMLSSLSDQVQGMGIELPQLDQAMEALSAQKTDMVLKDLE